MSTRAKKTIEAIIRMARTLPLNVDAWADGSVIRVSVESHSVMSVGRPAFTMTFNSDADPAWVRTVVGGALTAFEALHTGSGNL
jgi:hypothetical protein